MLVPKRTLLQMKQAKRLFPYTFLTPLVHCANPIDRKLHRSLEVCPRTFQPFNHLQYI